jgi:methanogenic corrinoid protein MtbC1
MNNQMQTVPKKVEHLSNTVIRPEIVIMSGGRKAFILTDVRF